MLERKQGEEHTTVIIITILADWGYTQPNGLYRCFSLTVLRLYTRCMNIVHIYRLLNQDATTVQRMSLLHEHCVAKRILGATLPIDIIMAPVMPSPRDSFPG